MDFQAAVVLVAVVIAAVFLGRRTWRSVARTPSTPGCHGCDECPAASRTCSSSTSESGRKIIPLSALDRPR